MENKVDHEFSESMGKKMMKKSTDKRVGADAAHELMSEVQELGELISVEASEIACHKGRKTVRKVDIRDAIKSLKESGSLY